ncbi:MAG TPA: hypothetical protein VMT18_02535 [Planctomycetota bacterium]|nr:hypothetical protein [Planctomycetota bacterium]
MWSALTLAAACAAPALQDAAPREARDVQSHVRRAALFKNGLAFVRREVALPEGAAELRLVDLPPPVHGTFWISADPARAKLGPAVARADERRELVPAGTIPELLRANLGRSVTLHLTDGTTLSGALAAMPAPEIEAPGGPDLRFGYVPPRPQPLELIFLDDGETTTLFSAADVRRLSAPKGELLRSFERRTPAVSLTVDCERVSGGETDLELAYLTRGLTWAPSYVVDISDSEHARLSAKAVVINESEDLVGATLEFVTGFPNLQFGSVVDPLALRGDLDAFFAALGQQPQAQPVVLRQSVMSNVRMEGDSGGGFPDYGVPGQGTAVEDLFFYEQRDVTLARGERALYGLFTLDVPFRHVYEWSIPDTIEPEPMRYGQPERTDEEEVWHSLRLENTSALPWTTAPAMTLSGGRLLGQDTLRYTAPGASTTLRITRAIDVAAERAEFETARERGLRPFGSGTYDLVTVDGILRITNQRPEPIELEVEKHLRGELTANPDEARVETVAEGLRRVNPSQRLKWNVSVDAGATLELRYTYTLYVPS